MKDLLDIQSDITSAGDKYHTIDFQCDDYSYTAYTASDLGLDDGFGFSVRINDDELRHKMGQLFSALKPVSYRRETLIGYLPLSKIREIDLLLRRKYGHMPPPETNAQIDRLERAARSRTGRRQQKLQRKANRLRRKLVAT